MTLDREGQDGLRERRRVAGRVPTERREHRHERGREPGGDEDVEQQLREHERRVVRVELGAGAVRPGEDPVADEPREVGARTSGRRAGSRPGAGTARATSDPDRSPGPPSPRRRGRARACDARPAAMGRGPAGRRGRSYRPTSMIPFQSDVVRDPGSRGGGRGPSRRGRPGVTATVMPLDGYSTCSFDALGQRVDLDGLRRRLAARSRRSAPRC